jgi:hypothetical protein
MKCGGNKKAPTFTNPERVECADEAQQNFALRNITYQSKGNYE